MKVPYFFKKLLHYFRLETELDEFQNVDSEIKKGIVFKGTNLWILVFAIIIASVGLNMNSTAVIIGAMLISPLMGPINGMGYSLATYDFELFRNALKNFLFAVAASLSASTIYFTLSPISTAHSELLARTSPTIYDVIIAFVGGMAGIIAIASKNKGNTIPGVAIATALMPPLCTAGYGLATAQFDFFFGAFYLFTINTVFIALSSIAVSKILNFPILQSMDSYHKLTIRRIIGFTLAIVFIPSIYFGYLLVQKERLTNNADKFIQHVGHIDNAYLLKSQLDIEKKKISLVYGGAELSPFQLQQIIKKSEKYKLNNISIDVSQLSTYSNKEEFANELESYDIQLKNTKLILLDLQSDIDSLKAILQNSTIIKQ